jgi:hypothetical protein
MTQAARALELHRNDECLQIGGRARPTIVAISRARTVAVAALIVAVDMARRSQRQRDRPIDPPQKSGRVQNHDRRPFAAPILAAQADPIRVQEKISRLVALSVFHARAI